VFDGTVTMGNPPVDKKEKLPAGDKGK